MKNKLFLVVYLTLIVGIAFIWYANKYIYRRTSAAQDAVAVSFTPSADSFNVGVQKDIDVIIQSPDAVKKISGFDLTFTAEGPIKFIKISNPAPFPGEDTSLYSSVIENVSDSAIHVSHVSLKSDAELPAVVHFRLTVEGTATGTGKVNLNKTASQVVGNVTGKLYAFGSVDEGIYTINEPSMNSVAVRFNPPWVKLDIGQMGAIELGISEVTANQGISGFHYVISYDTSIIEVVSVSDPIDATTGGDSNKFTKVKNQIDAAAGIIDLTYVSPIAQDQLPKQPKLTLTIKGKQVGAAQFTITNKEVTGNVPGNAYVVNVFPGSYEVATTAITCSSNNDCAANYVCSSTNVCEPLICPLGFPICKEGSISNHQCITVDAPDGTSCGNGMSCRTGQCVPSVTLVPTGYCQANTECADNQICNQNTNRCLVLPCDIVSAACMRAVARNHSCVVEQDPDGTACTGGVCQSGLCVPGTISPTLPSAGNVKLNMKIRLQGILNKPAMAHPVEVKVSIARVGVGSSVSSRTVLFTPDPSGVWTGTTNVNVPATGGYKIFIKGPQHLQKRICSSLPTETASGTYRCGDNGQITLQNGDNTLDFSGVMLLTGDIPDQDGIVDSYDLAYMRLNFGSTDPKALSIADLNQDGVIDTQDYSLVIASLSVKYDEI